MQQRLFILCLLLHALTLSGWAQATDGKKSLSQPDSVRNDFEEWLRNAPQHLGDDDLNHAPVIRDSSMLQPLPPELPLAHPSELTPKHPPISINIMTPALRNNMRLAYHGHWLEEEYKSQKGGAMTIGINPIALIGWAVTKLLPKHKSKKERERERLQRILDNY